MENQTGYPARRKDRLETPLQRALLRPSDALFFSAAALVLLLVLPVSFGGAGAALFFGPHGWPATFLYRHGRFRLAGDLGRYLDDRMFAIFGREPMQGLRGRDSLKGEAWAAV